MLGRRITAQDNHQGKRGKTGSAPGTKFSPPSRPASARSDPVPSGVHAWREIGQQLGDWSFQPKDG